MRVEKDGLIRLVLDESKVDGKVAGKEEGEVEDELLILIARAIVHGGDVCHDLSNGQLE